MNIWTDESQRVKEIEYIIEQGNLTSKEDAFKKIEKDMQEFNKALQNVEAADEVMKKLYLPSDEFKKDFFSSETFEETKYQGDWMWYPIQDTDEVQAHSRLVVGDDYIKYITEIRQKPF